MHIIDPIEFTQITYPYVYYPVAIMWWLLGCYFATEDKKNAAIVLVWSTGTAILWPVVIYFLVLLALVVITLFSAWVIVTHVFYSTICLPYFYMTGYDEYLAKMSETVPWNYYKVIRYENGARQWIRLSDNRTIKIRYNTGDIVWFESSKYSFRMTPVKVKTNNGVIYKDM